MRNNAIPLTLQRIQGVIDYIEDHLQAEFGIRDLADLAGMSHWHFQRVFRATVGETVKNYIRRRRLSWAADRLLAGQDSVLDIALDAGFDSNEAFTRAFRAQFDVSPRAFRSNRLAPGFPQIKPQITQAYLEHLHRNVGLEPHIEAMKEIRLIGIKADLRVPHEAFDLAELGRPLWQAFLARLPEIDHRTDQRAALLCDIVSSSETEIRAFIMPCVEVSGFSHVPEGMVTLVRPPLKTASFSHAGHGTAWEYTMHYIFGAWLPCSGYVLNDAPAFFRFLPDQSPFDQETNLEYCIAIK
ncbi:AraC family transcriptional regulator [Chitinivorax tropicus]|uniref:AraC family transcriptional regulator n=1 Tax=Chitinivorax tropicus TaxID=714531 RepID=A0A840MLB7_9PROT|nr:AraC family transcriptional regulator [Chitinivorax tropicus]MBB5017929.1 AraC family transcriptional regulator [Chitinivorax tropicus]